jgi:hypothetical protein
MYVNGKMRPDETIPEMGGERIKKNDEGGEFNYEYIYGKNFLKCHNISPVQQLKNKSIKWEDDFYF